MKFFLGNNLESLLYQKGGNSLRSDAAKHLRAALISATGVSPVLFSRWCSNNSQPTLPQAVACAVTLGVSVDALCQMGDVA